MRRRLGARTRLWLGALAGGGVVLTHYLTYRLAIPDPSSREELLAETGHGYWPILAALALGTLVAGLAGLVIHQLSGPPDESRARLFPGVAVRLILLQAFGFASLEGLERLVALGGLEGFLTDPVLLLGLIIQVGVAFVGALLVVLLVKAVQYFVSRIARRWTGSPVVLRAPVLAVRIPRMRPASGGATLRGPPSLTRI